MRIAVWHNLPSGGGKRALYHMVKGLAARGHTLDAWCPSTATTDYLPLSEMITEHVSPFSWPTEGSRVKSRVDDVRALSEHCRATASQWNATQYDVLFAHPSARVMVPPIARHTRLPNVLYLHEPNRALYETETASQTTIGGLKALWGQMMGPIRARRRETLMREEALSVRACDVLVANSLFSRETFARLYGRDARVCYLGVDTEEFRPTGEPRGAYVVGLGEAAARKRMDRVIRAVAAVREDLRPELVWIGNAVDDAYLASMRKLAADCGVRLALRRLVSDADLRSLLSRAIALVYAPHLEPFGLAPLEANACGTPVVALAEGGVRETVRDGVNGFLISNDDPAAMGAALECLLRAPALADELGHKSREHVQTHWRWEKTIDTLEWVLQDAIAMRAGQG